MCNLTTIIVLLVILIVIEVIVFYQHFKTEEERDQHLDQLYSVIAVTALIGLALVFLLVWNRSDQHEYGLFRKKDKKVVPPVAVSNVDPGRKIYGNPMKQPNYKIGSKYQEPVDASKLYGGAAAAADINRRTLNRKK